MQTSATTAQNNAECKLQWAICTVEKSQFYKKHRHKYCFTQGQKASKSFYSTYKLLLKQVTYLQRKKKAVQAHHRTLHCFQYLLMQFCIWSMKQKKITAPVRGRIFIHKMRASLQFMFGTSILNKTWCSKLTVYTAYFKCIGQGKTCNYAATSSSTRGMYK